MGVADLEASELPTFELEAIDLDAAEFVEAAACDLEFTSADLDALVYAAGDYAFEMTIIELTEF